ncbi:hypothetical protein SEPCBS57363_002577 [Sporothrix epigloea]|uniref:Uncharacterized protein n=1 Tax=Sporothrix epigloea TaxID=1892477 RepID=A0ABP0DGN7_9PEZI
MDMAFDVIGISSDDDLEEHFVNPVVEAEALLDEKLQDMSDGAFTRCLAGVVPSLIDPEVEAEIHVDDKLQGMSDAGLTRRPQTYRLPTAFSLVRHTTAVPYCTST